MMFDNVTTYTPAVDELTDSLSSEETRTSTGLEARAPNGSLLQSSLPGLQDTGND